MPALSGVLLGLEVIVGWRCMWFYMIWTMALLRGPLVSWGTVSRDKEETYLSVLSFLGGS